MVNGDIMTHYVAQITAFITPVGPDSTVQRTQLPFGISLILGSVTSNVPMVLVVDNSHTRKSFSVCAQIKFPGMSSAPNELSQLPERGPSGKIVRCLG